MSLILVDNLDAGKMLDEDVRDVNGRLLLSRGQIISPKHLRILKIWGITEVCILDDTGASESTEAEKDPQKMEKAQAAIQLLFSKLDTDHPAVEQVIQCAIEHRYENNNFATHVKQLETADALAVQLSFKDIQRKINRGELKLPESPTIVVKLNNIMADPFASASDVAQIVSTSPSLTATIIKIVNSAAFGLPTKVDRISRAVSLLGTRQISALAIGVSVMQAFSDVARDLIDMTSFLIHSLSCATLTRILAALANMQNTEQLFVAGLLHDVGKLILFKYFPEYAKALFRQAHMENGQRSVYELENATIGKNHSRIASHLLTKWKFPISLQDNIVYHHSPSRSNTPKEAAIIQMADMITHGIGFGSSGEHIIPCFDAESWEKVGISPSTIKMTIRQATHQLQTIESIIAKI